MKTFYILKMIKIIKNFNQILTWETIIYMILNRLQEMIHLILMTKKMIIKKCRTKSNFILKIKAQKVKMSFKISQKEKS